VRFLKFLPAALIFLGVAHAAVNMTISWPEPADSQLVDYYVVEYQHDGTAGWVSVPDVQTCCLVVTELEDGVQNVTARVAWVAIAGGVQGPWSAVSDPASDTRLPGAIGQPTVTLEVVP